jgi:hypothetical protein
METQEIKKDISKEEIDNLLKENHLITTTKKNQAHLLHHQPANKPSVGFMFYWGLIS